MLWPGNRLQTPASNLLRETPCSPTSLLTVRGTSPASLDSFLSKASSRRSSHGTVSSSSTTCLLDSDTRTMSGRRVVTAMWPAKLQLMLKIHQQLPVFCRGKDSCTCSSGKGLLLPSSDKGDGFLGGSEPFCQHKPLADDFSDGLEPDHASSGTVHLQVPWCSC